MLNSISTAEARIRASESLVSGVEILGKMALEIEVNCKKFPEKEKSGVLKNKHVRVPSKAPKKCNFCQRVGYLEAECRTKLKKKDESRSTFSHNQQMKDQQRSNLPQVPMHLAAQKRG
jgi:hypothetical protein